MCALITVMNGKKDGQIPGCKEFNQENVWLLKLLSNAFFACVFDFVRVCVPNKNPAIFAKSKPLAKQNVIAILISKFTISLASQITHIDDSLIVDLSIRFILSFGFDSDFVCYTIKWYNNVLLCAV